MRLLRNYINELKVVYPISGYLLLLAALVFFKVKIYNYNLSAMIGIWKGFATFKNHFSKEAISTSFSKLYNYAINNQN